MIFKVFVFRHTRTALTCQESLKVKLIYKGFLLQQSLQRFTCILPLSQVYFLCNCRSNVFLKDVETMNCEFFPENISVLFI